jgi:hypothetical protein
MHVTSFCLILCCTTVLVTVSNIEAGRLSMSEVD